MQILCHRLQQRAAQLPPHTAHLPPRIAPRSSLTIAFSSVQLTCYRVQQRAAHLPPCSAACSSLVSCSSPQVQRTAHLPPGSAAYSSLATAYRTVQLTWHRVQHRAAHLPPRSVACSSLPSRTAPCSSLNICADETVPLVDEFAGQRLFLGLLQRSPPSCGGQQLLQPGGGDPAGTGIDWRAVVL